MRVLSMGATKLVTEGSRGVSRHYWTTTRVVGTYVLARCVYNIMRGLWSGPGRYISLVLLGCIIVSMIK